MMYQNAAMLIVGVRGHQRDGDLTVDDRTLNFWRQEFDNSLKSEQYIRYSLTLCFSPMTDGYVSQENTLYTQTEMSLLQRPKNMTAIMFNVMLTKTGQTKHVQFLSFINLPRHLQRTLCQATLLRSIFRSKSNARSRRLCSRAEVVRVRMRLASCNPESDSTYKLT